MSSDKEIQDFNLIFEGLQSEVLKIQYKKYFSEIVRKKLKNNCFAGTNLQAVYDEAMLLRQSENSGQYYFITICPYEDIKIEDFIKVMDKVLKKKWFVDYIYVYEQRQDDIEKPIFGIHTHIVVKRSNIAKSDVIREVYNTCKKIVGSKQSIDVKLLKDQSELNIRLNYILGNKSDPDKRKKQIVDRHFRERFNLQDSYSKGDIDTSGVQSYTSYVAKFYDDE